MNIKNLINLLNNLEGYENENKSTGIDLYKDQPVLVRTYSAGVHFGILHSRFNNKINLKYARRIWSWAGKRFTLSEIANNGLIEARLSEEVDLIEIEPIEIILLKPEIYDKMKNFPTYTP